MQKIKKTFLVLATSSVMLAVPAVYATGNGTSIVNSGDNTTVNTSTSQTSSVTVNNTNTATVDQNVNANSNTGNNTANSNISTGGTGTSILTGAAAVSTALSVAANNNTTAIGGVNPVSANMTDVTNTGDDANVNTTTSTNTSVQVNNTNMAQVSQSCGGGLEQPSLLFGFDLFHMGGCNANTGHNSANSNIGGAGITTGAAAVGVTMTDQLNKNRTLIGDPLVLNMGTGLLNDTSITNTGDDAVINTSATNTSDVGVNNLNEAMINQMVNANSNSGWNHANENIGGAHVMTGAAGVGVNLGTNVNTNTTGIGGGLGLLPVGANLNDFVNTGDDLLANTSISSNSSATLNNLSSLYTQQFVWQHSNSGHNYSSSNVGSTMLGTNGAGISVGLSSGGNTNTTVLGGFLNSLMSLLLM